ncbi:transcription termination factor MTEF1, chloroplastic-like [Bidens hawaiensis]|uniref:transcription termination factor MTEF1, chloroplastic-like n=1 Tax=Bidens hawaiensis TaxID=980011 RepID=UPI00404B7439
MHLLLHPTPTLCSYSGHHPPPHHHLQFQTSNRTDIRYLKSLGITTTPSPQAISHLLKTIQLFKSKGFSEPDFPRLAFLAPNVFAPTYNQSTITSVFNFLTVELSTSPQDARTLILKCPQLLESDPESCLKPTLEYLKSLGITRLNNASTLNAHLLNSRVDKMEEKMRFLEGVGFSREESRRVCGRFPVIFGYGIENNLTVKYLYLVKDMKRDGIEEVNKFPMYFGFSLDKRIKVRHFCI